MNKLRALIVEDEAPARDLIKAFLKDHDHIELIGECDNGFDAVKNINEQKPDLVFLDIQMPKLTGFEMIELLDEVPEIIFTTAFDQFAIKAFELNAVDYIMKPFSKQRFAGAVKKVSERIQQKKTEPKAENFIRKMKEDVREIERIFVKTGSKIDVIPVTEIVRIEAQDDYVDIITAKGKFLKKETMNYLEKALPENTFVRVHRSHIVNINNIQKIEKYGKDSSVVILKDGSSVQVSKSRIKELKNQLGF
ncbi:MAG: DNA-binding response regulator [Bacteroidetes bacterium]|nr:MAG: DNA-binding response regulator [Bacteroidota bacterium]RLD43954.1 MAG: DNA-binding response regulator [Bacteroidota bacterium]RLD74626.1 MAG: DNA-binding response regulator [Bacteroidota bacterium]RLD89162.1 MAG: DNA-binding response regulator [Bacteroidota bacterium]